MLKSPGITNITNIYTSGPAEFPVGYYFELLVPTELMCDLLISVYGIHIGYLLELKSEIQIEWLWVLCCGQEWWSSRVVKLPQVALFVCIGG